MPYGHNRSPVCGRNLPLSVRHPGWMRFTEACLLKTENNNRGARALSASIANRPPGRSDGSPVTSLIFATQQRVQVLIAPLAFKKDILPVMRLATKAQPFQEFDRAGIAGVYHRCQPVVG